MPRPDRCTLCHRGILPGARSPRSQFRTDNARNCDHPPLRTGGGLSAHTHLASVASDRATRASEHSAREVVQKRSESVDPSIPIHLQDGKMVLNPLQVKTIARTAIPDYLTIVPLE